MAVTSIISVLSGIGGGILYSSLLVYFENFTIKESVPISLGIVLMQNSIMIFYYLYKKHPVSNQNLMIFDNFLILVPNIFIGNLFGYYLFVILPHLLVTILFVLTLLFFIYSAFHKGFEKFNEETIELKEVQEKKKIQLFSDDSTIVSEKTGFLQDTVDIAIEEKPEEQLILKIIVFILSFFFYCLGVFLRGNSLVPSFAGIKYCSWLYFSIYILGIVCQIAIVIVVIFILFKQHEKTKNEYQDIKSGKIIYDFNNLVFLSLIGMFIGVTSILFGAAGGSINNIMLILIGFDPLVAVATSVIIIEVTSISNLLVFILNGLLAYEYIIFSGMILILTTIIGLLFLNIFLDKFKRTSFYCFFMAVMYVFSFILMII